jgi:hypothetical protein
MPSRHIVRAEVPKKAENCSTFLRNLVSGQKISLTFDEYSRGENALFWYFY